MNVRSRLTLIGEPESAPARERENMLSRSRYLAPAVHSLRFGNEYFKPAGTVEIEKPEVLNQIPGY